LARTPELYPIYYPRSCTCETPEVGFDGDPTLKRTCNNSIVMKRDEKRINALTT
jgi:hypothetical protein